MTTWHDLQTELDTWLEIDRVATLWWRDDDAVDVTPALEAMTARATSYDIPVALAVIPAYASPELAKLTRRQALTTVLQHGLTHTNHEPPSHKKAELADHRPTREVLQDITEGARLLASVMPQALPVLVPPWNRIAASVTCQLSTIGIQGLSTFQPREESPSALIVANTHVDIVNWRGTRGFTGVAATLTQMILHLSARRKKTVDPVEPTGILTHHLIHDDECWQFLDDLFTLTRNHPAVQWLSAHEIFHNKPTD